MDKTFRGLAAGTIGAIVMNLLNLVFYYIFRLTEIKFLDWGSIIMLGSKPESFIEMSYGLLIHILWTGSLGIIFSYLIPKITYQGYLIKGGLYAFLLTFIFRAIVMLYNVPVLNKVSVKTSLINTSSAFLWGLILAALLKKFEKSKNEN